MTIAVGDMVTYRTRPNVLALTGCRVVELGQAADGRPAAMIDIGRFAEDGKPVGVLIEHLEKEP